MTPSCPSCSASIHLKTGEVERILAQTFAGQKIPVVDDATYASRLATCQSCPDLRFNTTCRHCGCLVAVRAKMAEKSCPAPASLWSCITPAAG